MRQTFVLAGVISVVALAAGCAGGDKEPAAPGTPPPAVSPTQKAVTGKPPQAFNQSMNAADGKAALESEGYSVQINWGNGRRDRPLSSCVISGVDGMRGDAPPSNTTVYLTVTCP